MEETQEVTLQDVLDAFANPEIVPVTKRKKRQAGEVNWDGLTPSQTAAATDLRGFVEVFGGSGMWLLEGSAGVGKTYLISRFIEWCLVEHKMKIAVTAPTNKAVKVLQRMAEYRHENLNYATVHKLLGLREKIDQKTGQTVFLPDPEAKKTIHEYDMVVVDEASMLSDDLFHMLQPYTRKGLKLIFVADGCQIPPIGMENSIPLNETSRLHFQIGRSLLTEIVRQAKGNPIIALAEYFRKNIRRPTEMRQPLGEFADGVGFADSISGSDIDTLLNHMFCSPHFKADADYCKVIAWRNVTVDSYNRKIRQMIYGKGVTKLMLGEKLLADKPIFDNEDHIIFTTNSEFVVHAFTEETLDFSEDGYTLSIKVYKARVGGEDQPEDKCQTITIVHEDADDQVKAIKKSLWDDAMSKQQAARKKAFEDYYDFCKLFAEVKYNYAITGHKCQGSTYRNAIVCEKDILYNSNVYERNRIRYTAITRASHLLFIIR